MVLPHRISIITTLILVLPQTPLEAKKTVTDLCPLGFKLAFTKTGEIPICYRLKGPEKAEDMYRDCVGNLYSIKLYKDLNIHDDKKKLWTEYRTAYIGGPFIDWSYRKSTGKLFDKFEKKPEEELVDHCVVFNTAHNYEYTECNGPDDIYRYCFVKPYPTKENMSSEGCEDLTDSKRIWSPSPTCLVAEKANRGSALRANWSQSLTMCKKIGGTLLNRGWIYSNIPWLHTSKILDEPEYPLGVIYYPNHTLKNANNADGGLIPPSDWNFAKLDYPTEKSFGFVREGSWYLANSSYIFSDVICEKPVILKTIDLRVIVQEDTIVLNTNDTIHKENISCFTDSKTYYPTPVEIELKDDYTFILKPISDGYYWCVLTDPVNYIPSESNKALFIRVQEELSELYAAKIIIENEYDLRNIEEINGWKDNVKEYIYVYTNYTKCNKTLDADQNYKTNEETLKKFMMDNKLNGKYKGAVTDVKLKQVYRDHDRQMLLVHMTLRGTMLPLPIAGTWNSITVVYMRSANSCTYEGRSFRDKIIDDCQQYTCDGDFNVGYDYVISDPDTPCTTTPNAVTVLMPSIGTTLSGTTKDLLYRENASDSSEESTEKKPTKPDNNDVTTEKNTESPPPPPTTPIDPTEVVTVNTPTRPPLPTTTDAPTTERPRPQPEEQLEQVMQDLESLLNDPAVVSMNNISTAFEQVNDLLAESVDLEIPETLLHLLDGIGARIELNGLPNATEVRSNIALLVTNADPSLPVRGLRIAATASDVFEESAFEIIREDANPSQLQSDQSEVVVQLPESIGTSTRRISFVAFRNDRAFQTSNYFINSRILSVNVENLTHFERNQYIDIHFSPSGDPNRNESRACAFWEFQANDSGFWSQEGCTFIKATVAGALDTCRCDHLTHFAEILIPKAVFSERNENALELLTVIGCCLSIMGLVIVGLTALLFRSWRRDFNNKIWLQLCVSIFLLVLCFLVVIFVQFDTYNIPCMLIGITLHYSTLASFCWMLVAAVLSYRRLVVVFNRDTSHRLMKAAAFAWGAPFAVVGVLLSVDPHSYAGRFGEKTPTGAFCYPSGLSLWLAVCTPIIIMLIANWMLFFLIVRSVFASRRVQRHGETQNEALRCASVSSLLVFLFGLPWVFGVFSFNIVAAYLFTLTATYQGFILFLFFVLGNKKTRDLWLNKLKIKQTRKVPVTSSTYANRSTGTSGRPMGPASLEQKNTKHRSVAALDDSRFS